MLTPQLSPHGIGFGTVKCLRSAQALVIAVRFSNGTRSASGGTRTAVAFALQVLAELRGHPQAQVGHGTTDSLKYAEKDTQHFGLAFLGRVILPD